MAHDSDFVLVDDSESDDAKQIMEPEPDVPDDYYQPYRKPKTSEVKPKTITRVSKSGSKFMDILNSYALWSEDIKSMACTIYPTLQTTNLRKEAMEEVVFYCVWRSLIALRRHTVPTLLARDMNLPPERAQRAINRFSYAPGQPRYSGYMEPAEIIVAYGRELGFSDEILNHMRETYVQLVSTHKKLKDWPPNTLAGAFIWNYINTYGIKLDVTREDFALVFTLRSATIITAASEIAKVENATIKK